MATEPRRFPDHLAFAASYAKSRTVPQPSENSNASTFRNRTRHAGHPAGVRRTHAGCMCDPGPAVRSRCAGPIRGSPGVRNGTGGRVVGLLRRPRAVGPHTPRGRRKSRHQDRGRARTCRAGRRDNPALLAAAEPRCHGIRARPRSGWLPPISKPDRPRSAFRGRSMSPGGFAPARPLRLTIGSRPKTAHAPCGSSS